MEDLEVPSDKYLRMAYKDEWEEGLKPMLEAETLRPDYTDDSDHHMRNNLVIAAAMGNARNVIDGLTRKYPGVNYRNRKGRTAVHYCCALGHISALVLLSNYPGISYNVQDKNGQTPMHLAIINNSVNCIEFLTQQDWGKDKRDRLNKETAIEMAGRIHGQRGIAFLKVNEYF